MKIVYVVNRYPTLSETFISRKVEYLLRQGHDVTILCTAVRNTGTPWKTSKHQGNVRIIYIGDVEKYTLSRYWLIARAGVSALKALMKHGSPFLECLSFIMKDKRDTGHSRSTRLVAACLLGGGDFDLVHVHFGWNLWPVRDIARFADLRVVLSLLGSDLSLVDFTMSIPERDRYFQDIGDTARCIIVSSDHLKRLFLNAVPDYGKSLHVLHPEVDVGALWAGNDALGKESQDTRSLRLLTVARLHWVKGHLYALHAAAILKAELGLKFRWTFVGSGPERIAAEVAAADLGVSDVVDFVDGGPFAEIKRYFFESDVFVLPSVREEFGVVLVEAAAAGLPIVATRVGGIPDAVEEGLNAVLVSPRSPEEMAQAILKLAESPELRKRMSDFGKKHVRKFDARRIHKRMMAIYEDVLTGV